MSQEQTNSSRAVLFCQSGGKPLQQQRGVVGSRQQSLHRGKAPQLRHPHPAAAAKVPGPGFHPLLSAVRKKGLAICQIPLLALPSNSRRQPLERWCRVLFVHTTRGPKLVFCKLNPKKPANMKIFCFHYSQLKALPTFLVISYLSGVLHFNLVTSILPALCV